MRIFVLAGDLPLSGHSVRAANRVLYSLLEEFGKAGHQVAVQATFQKGESRALSKDEQQAADALKKFNVTVLQPFFQRDYLPKTGKNLLRLLARGLGKLFATRSYLYPAVALQPRIEKRARDFSADVLFLFWNPECVAATQGIHIPKLVYYGMPDFAARMVQLKDLSLFNRHLSFGQKMFEWWHTRRGRAHHLRMMQGCEEVVNLSAEHALWYAAEGHPHSIYIQNMWPATPNHSTNHSALQGKKPRIVGSLGRPTATGNTYGLLYIGKELLPRLDAIYGKDGYEMHIFGQGTPFPEVQKYLQHPAVKMRGFVEDIDKEICESHVFLVANNTGPYRGSHTRFLHGWSLKACCIGDSYNTQANPEMVSGENILLGETADDIAELIKKATSDASLRERIAKNGYETYQRFFTPHTVAGRLIAELDALVHSHS